MRVSKNMKSAEMEGLVLTKHVTAGDETVSDDGATIMPEEYYTYSRKAMPKIPFAVTFPGRGTYTITQYDAVNKIYYGFCRDFENDENILIALHDGVASYTEM